MKTGFRKGFAWDVNLINDQHVLRHIQAAFEEAEATDNLSSIGHLKKITGTSSVNRIRVGDHRNGIAVEGNTVEFIRCLPRRDLYRYFP